MPTAVVTGCNSGIGNCWAEILISEGYKVYATDRDVGEKLKNLKCETSLLDVTDPNSIAQFKKSFGDQPCDILLNIAGIMIPSAEDSLETTSHDKILKMFNVNAFGPILLTQALLPNLLASKNAKVGVISSRVGSMTDNTSGSFYGYRASKAAVNSFFKSLAVDLKDKNIPVVIMHPGFAKTGLDTTKKTHALKEAVEPTEAAEKLWGIFKAKGLDDTGKFWHRENFELPW